MCPPFFFPQIVAFVLEAFFAEMELEKDGEADIQVRTIFVPTTNSLYLYLENCWKASN